MGEHLFYIRWYLGEARERAVRGSSERVFQAAGAARANALRRLTRCVTEAGGQCGWSEVREKSIGRRWEQRAGNSKGSALHFELHGSS